MDFMCVFLIFVLLNHISDVTSSVYTTSSTYTWQEARNTCNLAKKTVVCEGTSDGTSTGGCEIKLSGSEVTFRDDSPVWVGSYLLRTHFIYNYGCRTTEISKLDAGAVHYKIGPDNDVTECAIRCGDTTGGYALYDYNCFCVDSSTEKHMADVSYDICNIDCREGSFEKCGGAPSSTNYTVTYYKIFKTGVEIPTTSSCIAAHWGTDFRIGFTFKNCNDKHGFACAFPSSSDPTFYNFDNSTWAEAKEYCYGVDGRISDDLVVDVANVPGLQTNTYYWSAYHRRHIYRWDTPLSYGQFGLKGCIALTSSMTLEPFDCNSQFHALCEYETTTTDTGLSTTPGTTTKGHTVHIDFNATFDVVMTPAVTPGIVNASIPSSDVTQVITSTSSSSNGIAAKNTGSITQPSTSTSIGESTTGLNVLPSAASKLTYSQSTTVYIVVPVVAVLFLFLVVVIIIATKMYRRYRQRKLFRLYSISDNTGLVGNELLQDLQNEEYTYLPQPQPRIDFVARRTDTYDHLNMYRERPKSRKVLPNNMSAQSTDLSASNQSNEMQPASNLSNVGKSAFSRISSNNVLDRDEENIIRRDLLFLDQNHVKFKNERSDSLTNYLPMGSGVYQDGSKISNYVQPSNSVQGNANRGLFDMDNDNRFSFEFGSVYELRHDSLSGKYRKEKNTDDINQSENNGYSKETDKHNANTECEGDGTHQTSVPDIVHQGK